jgi:hypothetical protein
MGPRVSKHFFGGGRARKAKRREEKRIEGKDNQENH